MRCEDCREALSARLDGETEDVTIHTIDRHVAACASCSTYLARIESLHRVVRVRIAEPVPDLTPSLLPATRREPHEGLRYALLTVSLTSLVLAIPELIGSSDAHSSRDLAAFATALSVSLLYVVWRPDRAAGMVPMGAALAAAVLLSSSIDLVNGNAPAGTEAHHALELLGVGLLFALARLRRTEPHGAPATT